MKLVLADDLEIEITKEISKTISEIFDSLFKAIEESEDDILNSVSLSKAFMLIYKLFF